MLAANALTRRLRLPTPWSRYSQGRPEPGRRPFAQALLHARGNAPVTVLVTLRADFYSQIITLDRELSDVLAPVQVNIGALNVGRAA